MILLALFFLQASPSPAPIDRTLRVPPADFRGLRLSIRNHPANLDLEYSIRQGGDRVRLVLMPEADEARFRAGRKAQELSSTTFQRSGRLQAYIATPGDYTVIVDNRLEPKMTATVHLQGTLVYDTAPKDVKYLSSERRWLVISTSLLFFFSIAWFAGRRLWAATAGQKMPPPPPPYT